MSMTALEIAKQLGHVEVGDYIHRVIGRQPYEMRCVGFDEYEGTPQWRYTVPAVLENPIHTWPSDVMRMAGWLPGKLLT